MTSVDPGAATIHAAVIDITSDAVRLIVYQVFGGSLWPIHRESIAAVMPRDFRSVVENEADLLAVRVALRRYHLILADIPEVRVIFATDAVDGDAAFEAALVSLREAGFEFLVLTGSQRANLMALGAVEDTPRLAGVVLGLDERYLDVANLPQVRDVPGVSIPAATALTAGSRGSGPLGEDSDDDLALKHLFAGRKCERLYVTGGAFGAVGRLHMAMSDYPLRVLVHLETSAQECLHLCHLVERQSEASLLRLPGISRRRAKGLGEVARVLRQAIALADSDVVIFCSTGRREGMVRLLLSLNMQSSKPLADSARLIAAASGSGAPPGPGISSWLSTAFGALAPIMRAGNDPDLIAAAAELWQLSSGSDTGIADLAKETVLRANFTGSSHPDRVFLAEAVHASSLRAQTGYDRTQDILTVSELRRARALGLAMRLGSRLSAGNRSILNEVMLEITAEAVHISLPRALRGLLSSAVHADARSLASHLGRDLQIKEV